MTLPTSEFGLLILEAKWELTLLQHGEQLLPMKLMFLNIITSRKGAEAPTNI
jgi:hypothetical protein